ncbi:hypothetical protein V6O07_18435, partial [Arthrospira platensis SPKY2]
MSDFSSDVDIGGHIFPFWLFTSSFLLYSVSSLKASFTNFPTFYDSRSLYNLGIIISTIVMSFVLLFFTLGESLMNFISTGRYYY